MTSCPSMPKTYTVKEVADILGYSTNSIYTFLKENRIKGIRVGRGRFRIPEDELSRILHLSKKTENTGIIVAPTTISEPITSAPIQTEPSTVFQAPAETEIPHVPVPQATEPVLLPTPKHEVLREKTRQASLPNIFDWFVGLGAIVSGVGLFLFNQSNEVNGGMIAPYLSSLRIILIAVGLGVVVSNLVTHMRVWRRIFFVLLALAAFGSVWSFIRIQDYDGAMVYGAMGFMVAVNAVLDLDGIDSILSYLTFLLVGIVVLLLVGTNVAHVQEFIKMFGLTNTTAAFLLAVVAGTNLVMYWIGYRHRSVLFWIGALVTGGCCFAAAVWYGNLEYWSRSMYFIVLGYFAMLTPLWPSMLERVTSAHDRAMVHVFLGRVSVIIIIAVFAIYEVQQTLWVQKQREFHNQLGVASLLLQHGFTTVKEVLTTTSLNTDLVIAAQKKDLNTINKFAKVVYESHSYIRRIIVLDAEGNGIALYPYGTFDQENLSFRDYFIAVRNTRQPYTSSVFESMADQAHRQVVSISVPLISDKNDFVGVLSASVDLDQLNLELQQMADQRNGEVFTVVDTKGNYVLNNDMSMVGRSIAADDPARAGLGKPGAPQNTAMVYNGLLGATSYDVVPEMGWSIILRAPISTVVAVNAVAILSILGVTTLVLVLTTVVFYFFTQRRSLGGGSP